MRRYTEHIAYHMKGIALLAICFLFSVHAGHAQYGKVTVKATNIFVGASDTLFATSDFHFTSGSTIINQGAMVGNGAWKNFGIFQERTGIVIMGGGGSNCLQGTSIFNDLTINKGSGTLDINTSGDGGDQKIYGVLTLKSGTFDISGSDIEDSLILLSDDLGTARIAEVTGGIFDGNFTMERYIGPAVDEGWRLFSVPVNGTKLRDWNDEILMTCVGGDHLGPGVHWTSVYTYDETVLGPLGNGFSSDDTPPNTAGVDTADILIPGKGYMVWVSQSLGQPVTLTADASGTLSNTDNLGTVTVPVTYTSSNGDFDDGWNLVGNPYPCPVDWDDVTLGANISSFAYVRDPVTEQYIELEQGNGDVIASHQGFWVKAVTGSIVNNSITFEESHKSTANATFYKTHSDGDIKLILTGYGNQNHARIRFRNNGTYNYDWNIDAYKLASTNNLVPNLSARTNDGYDLQLSSIPEDYEQFSAPLRIFWAGDPPVEPLYQLELVVDNLPAEVHSICLQDLKTGSTINMVEGDVYSFDASWDPNPTDRFVVHGPMSGCATSAPEWLAEQESITVKEIDGFLHIDFLLQEPSNMTVQVTNLLGQTLHTQTGSAYKSTLTMKAPNETAGAYFVTVTTKTLTVTQKVLSGL